MPNKFDLYVLRRLYNPDRRGKGVAGRVTRREISPTLMPKTLLMLRSAAPLGPGLYGSSVIELALRVLLAIVGILDIDTAATELVYAVSDRSGAIKNLDRLLTAVNKRMDEAEAAAKARLGDGARKS